MAYTTINKYTDHHNCLHYNGTGSSDTKTVGFAPDLVWIKCSSLTYSYDMYDNVRGTGKRLQCNGTGAEDSGVPSGGVTAFTASGFTLGGGYNGDNASGQTYTNWNWKAGTTSGINQGGASTTPSAYSFNQTAGFSIIKYTGTGSTATIPHGLTKAPEHIVVKALTFASGWINGATSVSSNLSSVFQYNQDTGLIADSDFNSTAPTNAVFTVGNNNTNKSGEDYIAYCWHSVRGYSAFGYYYGNGNGNNGTFIYTGFAPKYVVVKRTDANGNAWRVYSQTADGSFGYNGEGRMHHLNLTNTMDDTGDALDFWSTGFKHVTSSGDQNGNGSTYFYMAFGETIVGTNGVPAPAK